MALDKIKILQSGDKYGNDMIVKMSFPGGLEILGLATKNLYSGDWDFGPTWNYVINSDSPFLMDTGRRGMGPLLMQMMESGGTKAADLEFVILSHGHEDHDGGLFALKQAASMQVMAHEPYDALTAFSRDQAPSERLQNFPASCWHCPMPESFSEKHCRDYHNERNKIGVTSITGGVCEVAPGVSVLHVPGHSPDCVAVLVNDEVLLAGDTILPEITPHPSREQYFKNTRCMLPSHYGSADQLYGLRAYIRSVKSLRKIADRFPNLTVLPGHRFTSNGDFNLVDLGQRCDELVQHHIQRCSDILRLITLKPKTPEEIAHEYFKPELLAGFGMHLATNELLSHFELLELSGDILWRDGKVVSTSNRGFEGFIQAIH